MDNAGRYQVDKTSVKDSKLATSAWDKDEYQVKPSWTLLQSELKDGYD